VVPVIDQFRDAVQAKYNQPGFLKDIPASQLLVYENRECFDHRSDTQNVSVPLRASHLIGTLGATEDSALIVVVPSLEGTEPRIPVTPDYASWDKPLTQEKMRNLVEVVKADIAQLPSPSNLAKNPSHQQSHVLFWHRPFRMIPCYVMHKAFSNFLKDIHDEKLDADANLEVVTRDLVSEMPKGFSKESPRRTAFSRILQMLFHGIGTLNEEVEVGSSSGKSGARVDIALTVNQEQHVVIVAEVKRELGIGSAEVVCETLGYYSKVVDELSKTHGYPCFVVLLCGPWMAIGGAYTSYGIGFDNLTGFFPLWDCSELELKRIMCYLQSLRNGVIELAKYYENSTDILRNFLFPFYTFMNPESCLKKEWESKPIVYVEKLERMVYKAQVEGEEVIVKFAESYCSEAHLACGVGAPDLYLVDRNTVSRHVVVVMAYLNGYRPFYTLLHEEFEPYAEKVESIIREMHQKGYAHGDIRSPNILYHPITKDVKLIDFDMAGAIGEARYPPFLNPEVKRPDGVAWGASITKEHDLASLALQFEKKRKRE
jgi:hypothetical protein